MCMHTCVYMHVESDAQEFPRVTMVLVTVPMVLFADGAFVLMEEG